MARDHAVDRRQPDLPKPSQFPAPWRVVGAGVGLAGIEGCGSYLHPALGEVLLIADVVTPVVIVFILLSAILLGSDKTVERVFRLLRWVANRPEPAAPAPPRTLPRRRRVSA